jgi:hypothetical protein
MNFVLLNLVLWPLIILVGVPLLVHLFARTRPPVYNFSSIEFILRIIRQTNRIKKPQDWILLVIRTLIFAAIILVFLQPLYFSKKRLSTPFERKNVVLIVDATASMAYSEGAQTRFASACAEASEILSGLSARDTANLVWLKAKPAPVFPDMGVNFSHLQSELRRARVTSEAGDAGEAMRIALRLLEPVEGKREICIVSDFQKSGWEKADLQAPPGIDIVKVKTGKEPGINGAVSDIYFDPSKPLVDEDISVCCDVYNYSGQPRRRTVFLSVQESRQSQDVMIPPWNKATAVFKYKFAEQGIFPVRISLNEDSFAGDDSRWALVEVRDFLHVGITGAEPATARTWRRALDAVGWARTELLATAEVARLAPFDVIMLSGDDGSTVEKLGPKLSEGCTVVWAPSVAGAGLVMPWTSNQAPVRLVWESLENPRKLKIAAEKDDAFRLFADGAHGDPARGFFSGRFAAPASIFANGDILLAYDDGIPALARIRHVGSLFVWNMPLQPEFSDYAGQAGFLPLLAEILLVSRTRVDRGRNGSDFLPGERVAWRLDSDIPTADVKLTGIGDKVLAVEEYRTARDSGLIASESTEPGLYSWKHQGKQMGYSTVNFPVIESDLRAMAMEELSAHGAIGLGEGSAVRLLREGVKLWPVLLALAVLLALVEGLALIWVERT